MECWDCGYERAHARRIHKKLPESREVHCLETGKSPEQVPQEAYPICQEHCFRTKIATGEEMEEQWSDWTCLPATEATKIQFLLEGIEILERTRREKI